MSVIVYLNSHNHDSIDIINIGGGFMTTFLIISLSIALLLVGTKYWNKITSDTFDICSHPLLLVFVMIIIFKIVEITQGKI